MKLIPLNTKKQTTKFTSAKFQRNVSPSICHIRNSMTRRKTVDLDEGAHHELYHQDLHCLQGQLLLARLDEVQEELLYYPPALALAKF